MVELISFRATLALAESVNFAECATNRDIAEGSESNHLTGRWIEYFDVLAEELLLRRPSPLQASLSQSPVQLDLLVVVSEVLGLVHPLDQCPIAEPRDVHYAPPRRTFFDCRWQP
ncbi:hypothetical protein H7J86_32695 [Mycobacterium hackensackense]|uniref:hypothetical protein n=1 Tax=Mycobacterium hackensackense TaxID=228909 RepID=UPI002265CBAB|nr:hypothetical protein [Mycobacterium hackensackense]MCV7256944.1 hypothetical protein [Mycobacterium hackensackense]